VPTGRRMKGSEIEAIRNLVHDAGGAGAGYGGPDLSSPAKSRIK
jgi:hypothetical protein